MTKRKFTTLSIGERIEIIEVTGCHICLKDCNSIIAGPDTWPMLDFTDKIYPIKRCPDCYAKWLKREIEMIDEKLIQKYNELLGDKAPKNPGCKYCIHSKKEEHTPFFCEIKWYCKKKPIITYESLNGYDLHFVECSKQNHGGQCQLFEQKLRCAKCGRLVDAVFPSGFCQACEQSKIDKEEMPTNWFLRLFRRKSKGDWW